MRRHFSSSVGIFTKPVPDKFTMSYIFIRKICTHEEYDKIDCSTI